MLEDMMRDKVLKDEIKDEMLEEEGDEMLEEERRC